MTKNVLAILLLCSPAVAQWQTAAPERSAFVTAKPAEPAAAPVVNKADVWITVPLTWHCQHCDDWLKTVSYELQRKGHTVAIKRTDEGTTFPRIWVNGREFLGNTSAKVILDAMKPTGPSEPAGVRKGFVAPAGFSSVPRDPRPGHWSFPGDIRSHLMRPPHNFTAADLAGLSYEQLLTLHDLNHERGYRPSRVVAAPVTYCPTCPR